MWRLSIPIGFVALFTGAAVWNVGRATLKSFFGSPHFEPGLALNMNREPRLGKLVEEICKGVGTKTPDAIVLHLGPEFFVMQGRLNVLNASPRGRILAISLPLLGVLKVGELRAIMSHEFAHFTGRDTLYSSIAMRVYMSAGHSASILLSMWMSGNWLLKILMALPLLPAAGVLFAYTWLFHLANMRLSRVREFRADYIAATHSGSAYMRSGLGKTVGYSIVMQPLFDQKCDEVLKQREPHDSPYRLIRKSLASLSDEASKAATDYMAHEVLTSGDSHPTVRNRLDSLPDSNGTDFPGLEAHALTLLAGLKQYEREAGEHLLQEFRAAERERLAADPTPHLH